MPEELQAPDENIHEQEVEAFPFSPMNRSFEAAKKRYEEEQQRSEEAQAAYLQKRKKRHITSALVCGLIYLVMCSMTLSSAGFSIVMFCLGAAGGLVLSIRNGGFFQGLLIFGLPAIAATLLRTALGMRGDFYADTFLTMSLYLGMGILVGYIIEIVGMNE